MTGLAAIDAVSAAAAIVVLGATAFVIWNKKQGVSSACCPHCTVKGHDECYVLEGVSAFGDVVEACKYCQTRQVFVMDGSKVTKLQFTAEEWRRLRGKVPTEGFRAAHKVAARARRVRSTPLEREASSGEWE